MPIAATDISSRDHRRARSPRSPSQVWSCGPESAALLVIALPLGWLTWNNGGVNATDQAVVFGWVLGCAAVASVVPRKEAQFALP